MGGQPFGIAGLDPAVEKKDLAQFARVAEAELEPRRQVVGQGDRGARRRPGEDGRTCDGS